MTKEREQILAGQCPICGKAPFKVPLSHIAKAHHIPARQARALFDLTYSESATDPTYHELLSKMRKGTEPPYKKQHSYNLSPRGARLQAAHLTAQGRFARIPKEELRRISLKAVAAKKAKRAASNEN